MTGAFDCGDAGGGWVGGLPLAEDFLPMFLFYPVHIVETNPRK